MSTFAAMNRTFAHRVTLPAIVSVVIIAALALFFFWQRKPAMVVAATLLTVLDVSAIERLIHTTYTLTADGLLIISRGRFASRRVVSLEKVKEVSVRHAPFWLYRYVLIEYGSNSETTAMTDNDDAFVHEMRKRIKKLDNED